MKLDLELIEAYLDGSLDSVRAAKLKLWLKEHPADQAKVQRQSRLRSLLADSAVEPSAAQSRKMWANIKARVQAEAASAPVLDLREPWYAFIFKPWGGTLSAGLATAALVVLAFVWHPWQTGALLQKGAALADEGSLATEGNAGAGASAAAPSYAKAKMAAASKKASVKQEEGAFAPSMAEDSAAPASAPAAQAAAGAGPRPMAPSKADSLASTEPTEVERALADNSVDGMIDNYLAAQRRAPSPSARAAQPSFERSSLSSPLAGLSRASADDDTVIDSKGMNVAQGGRDNNGFWDWRPAAVAMNRRDWSQVRLELDAARSSAAEAVERSFAGSALTLLSAPGAPLAGAAQPLPGTGELRVLGAGRWQLISDSRLARFSEGVSARLPGFRSEGDSLLLDLTFDRGTFSPGTRFTRVSGDSPAEVLDAQGRAVSVDEFSAPTGAVYSVSGRQLKLH
jgi:hypothetical protein